MTSAALSKADELCPSLASLLIQITKDLTPYEDTAAKIEILFKMYEYLPKSADYARPELSQLKSPKNIVVLDRTEWNVSGEQKNILSVLKRQIQIFQSFLQRPSVRHKCAFLEAKVLEKDKLPSSFSYAIYAIP
jgi:hypothetical protein